MAKRAGRKDCEKRTKLWVNPFFSMLRMSIVGEKSTCQPLPQNRHLWFKLVKIINVLCFVSLLEPIIRARPEYILDISLVVGCLTNIIVYKYQPTDRFFSKLIGVCYLFVIAFTACYEFWLR